MTALGLRSGQHLAFSPRTRRAFTPAQLGGLAFWYDAARSPVVASAGAVERWDDLSGNGNHAAQTTSAKRPSLSADAEGRAVLRFDGSNDSLEVPPPDMSGGLTLFVAWRIRTALDFRAIFSASSATASSNVDFFDWQQAAAADKAFQLFGKSGEADSLVATTPDSTEIQYAVITIGGGSATIRDLNGEVTDTHDGSFGTPAEVRLGAQFNGGTGAEQNHAELDLYELGLVTRVLDADDLARLEQYLRRRHDIAWNPLHIGADLAWWHDAKRGPFTLSGADVDQWDDISDHGRHWSQTGGARPQKTADAEGRDVIRFDGVDDNLAMGGTLPALEPFTAAVVYRVRERGDFQGVLSAAPSSGVDHEQFWTFQERTAASDEMQVFGRSSETSPDDLVLVRPDAGAVQIAVFKADAGSAELHDRDGADADAYLGSFGTPDQIVLGGRYDGGPFGFAAIDVLAAVGVGRALSGADIDRLVTWAARAWQV